MKNKYFSPEEAEKMLPLIRSIVRDILQTGRQIKKKSKGKEDSVNFYEVHELRNQLQRQLEEIENLGCFYKDWNFNSGLVDFPSQMNGEAVLLSWKSDEEHITHYHSYVDPFESRKPIPQELLTHLPTQEIV